jgi:hypothetical protein
MKTPSPILRHYSARQLAFYYLISKPSFFKWVALHQAEIGIRKGNYHTCAQFALIFRKFGVPPLLKS